MLRRRLPNAASDSDSEELATTENEQSNYLSKTDDINPTAEEIEAKIEAYSAFKSVSFPRELEIEIRVGQIPFFYFLEK